MTQSRWREILIIVAGALGYFLIGWLSLRFALTQANASAVWVLSGLCIGSLARFGDRRWPAVFLGPLLLNYVIARQNGVAYGPASLSAIGVALAEVGEALVGARLTRRYFGSPPTLASPGSISALLFWVSFVPALVSMGGGILSLYLTGLIPPANIPAVAVTWTLGNVAGTSTCAPLFFSQSWRGWIRDRLHFRVWESLALLAVLLLLVQTISGVHFSGWVERWPKSWLAVPLMLWIAIRLGRRTTMVAALLIMGTGVAQTVRGFPVFPADTPEQSLLSLQLFIVMVTVLGLTVSTLAHQLRLQRKAMESVLASQTLLETMVMEEKSVLAATAMHDLQSPLHGIRSLLEFARDRPERLSGTDREHLLADMQASVDRMLSMVATRLAPVKANRVEAVTPAEPCDLCALARRVVEAEAPAAGSKGIVLHTAIPEAPVVVLTEAIAVEHILGNFLSNAVKFSAPQASVTLALERSKDTIRLCVADEGPGIPEEDRRDIFSGRIRAHGAQPTAGEPSSGLGLYLAGRLAERLGARVSCEAGENGGSVFSLSLPA
ncbi:MAG: MASE1 domain-containing protein [Chthoniobacter sp.]